MSSIDSDTAGMAGAGETRLPWLPDWIHRMQLPLWISSPERRICFVNARAEGLLQMAGEECLDQHCADVVAGHRGMEQPFCAPDCPIRCSADEGRELEPVTLCVGTRAGGGGRWIQMLVIPLRCPDGTGPWLVHCALDADRAHRMEDYLTRVAKRNESTRIGMPAADDQELTRREREILVLLAEDRDLPTIAALLYVSHATVRNHVQNILRKLGVHSIQEAVALHLLRSDPGE